MEKVNHKVYVLNHNDNVVQHPCYSKGLILANFLSLMQPTHLDICCILFGGTDGTEWGHLRVSEYLFPYLRASLVLENWMG